VILVIVFAIAVALIGGYHISELVRGPSDHDRCLKNIERLEHELGIGVADSRVIVASPPLKEEYLVDRYGPVDPQSANARLLMARGLLYSGEWESALRYYQEER
jgi:hypothetical protein